MRLKWKLVACLLCLCSLCFASVMAPFPYGQKIYPVDSPVYEELVLLYVSTGRAQPSSAGPWSADELLRMLQSIPVDALDEGQKLLYDDVFSKLLVQPRVTSDDDSFGFSPAIVLSPELYFHTDTRFNTEPDWSYGFTERKPPLAFQLEGWAANHFYGFVDLSLGLTRYHGEDSPIYDSTAPEHLYIPTFRSNIPMLGIAKLGELSMTMPYRAFLAVGGDHWSLQIGRDRLSWGVGESGNLILGDHVPMHQFLRLSTYHKIFKYTFIASFFPHPVNYELSSSVPSDLPADVVAQYDADGSGALDIDEYTAYFVATRLNDPNHQMQGLSMFMGHRFEFRMFQDRLSFTLSETIMYQTLDGYFDIQVLNPLMLFHNMYIRGNANSLLEFELDFALRDGINIYGMFLIDDLAMGSEPTTGSDSNPNALAGMLGMKFAFPFRRGVFFGSAEAVYTDPYLYKRDGDVEYIIGFRETNNTAGQISGSGLKYHRYYLGYEYGGDVIVGNLRFGYTEPGVFTSSLLAQVRFKGLVGIDTPWSRYTHSSPPHAPSTEIEIDGVESGYHPVEATLRIEPSVEMELGRGLSVRTSLSFLTQWHRQHAVAVGPLFDFQMVVGATYRI